MSLPDPPKVFLHLDLDQFFVSVERLRDPSLRGRPVCVGGADPRARGAVACASYEAREFGIHAGMALRRAWALCPQAAFVSGSPERYLELSRAVLGILEERTPRVVPRSIDEFDVDLTGCERLLGAPLGVAHRLRAEIGRTTRLTSSVGLAGTPLTAKVATNECKPDGLLQVELGGEAAFLAPLPIRKLPGVGPKTEDRLRELGIRTVGDLAALDLDVVKNALGARGEQLVQRARGGTPRLQERTPILMPFTQAGACAPELEERPREDALPQSLSRARTFAEDQDDRLVLDAALVRLVERATAALRVQKLRARSLAVVVRYADLKTVSRRVRVPRGAQEHRLLALARRVLERLLERRLRIRRLGVAFSGLTREYEQLQLFEGPQARSKRALGQAMDRIRDKHGWGSVRLGSGCD